MRYCELHMQKETIVKLLTVVVPCYDSENYMQRCIESILAGGEDVEILIVDDGSKDLTGEIADSYAKKYPTVCRALHQENGGHGEAINTGLKEAKGIYFKVVDSDDWVERDSFLRILSKLKEFTRKDNSIDMMISNYVYDKKDAKHKKVMRYRRMLPINQLFGWNDLGIVPVGKYILMHSVIYRTQLLKDCGLVLPKHLFYVDNLFVYYPLPYVKTMYYIDVNLYHYFIGRCEQSVNEGVMISRIDQQIEINKLMIEQTNLWQLHSRKLRNYMLNYIEIITSVSSILLIKSKTMENYEKKKALWEYIRKQDARLYRYLRYKPSGLLVMLNSKKFQKFPVAIYTIIRKAVGFN